MGRWPVRDRATSRARVTRRFPVLPVISGALVIGVAVLVIAFILSRVEDEQHRGGPLRNPSPPEGAAPINTAFEGLTTFRGNAARSYYGEGPVPLDPVIGWRVAIGADVLRVVRGHRAERMVRDGVDGPAERRWSGEDGTIEVREGAYDGMYHFLDGLTGLPVRPPLADPRSREGVGDDRTRTASRSTTPAPATGGSGSSRRIAEEPLVLWSVDGATSVDRPLRNDDWDGAALVDRRRPVRGRRERMALRDPTAPRLRRARSRHGRPARSSRPFPGSTTSCCGRSATTEVSIENSVAFHDGILYFANSGGLVQGWDVSDVLAGGSQPGARVPVLDG